VGEGSLREDSLRRERVGKIVLSEMNVTISRSADVAGEIISEFFELPAAILAVTCIAVADRVSCGNMKSHNQLSGVNLNLRSGGR
jgi:hypothetical protein